MTLRLILMRHGKSDWDDPAVDDHDRVLNKRGQRSSIAIGQWLSEHDYEPDQILVSSAARTRQTADLVVSQLTSSPVVSVHSKLYLAAPEAMLGILKEKGMGRTVLMVAHNPGSAIVAGMLAARAPVHEQFRRYPTAATTVLDFSEPNWGAIDWNKGDVIDFIVPRDLL